MLDRIIELLELYKSHEFLWNTEHLLHSNKDARAQVFASLLEVFRKIKADATLAELKKKLDNMRTTYKKERKKVNF